MTYFLLVIATIIISIAVFINTSPEFGASGLLMNQERIEILDNYQKGKFTTDESTSGDIKVSTILKFFFPKNTEPKDELPIVKLSKDYFDKTIKETRLTWFGHSSVMLEIDEKKVLIDPMFTDYASPIKGYVVKKRYQPGTPMDLEDLPNVDLVLISHDHYDHLDYETITKLNEKVEKFFVPLGVGSHLLEWGINKDKITEFAWWDELEFKDLKLAFTPTRHFSGRGLTNRDSTLWGSWVIKGEKGSIFFSGDSGYSKYFKQIGDKYGPFDFTMIECGQYHEDWASIHMLPEQSVQAHVDLKGKVMMPIHWSSFTLSLHEWNEPVIRASVEAEKLGVKLITPKMGESVVLKDEYEISNWWKDNS